MVTGPAVADLVALGQPRKTCDGGQGVERIEGNGIRQFVTVVRESASLVQDDDSVRLGAVLDHQWIG